MAGDVSPPLDLLAKPTAVIGAGTLGRRIALMLGSRGGEVRMVGGSAKNRAAAKDFFQTRMLDVAKFTEDGAPGTLVLCEDLAAAVAGTGLVVESIPEKLAMKIELFGELDRLAPRDAILASNSSSFPTSRLIERVARPQRVANTHFMMPPERNIVEVMSCGHTDPAVIETLMQALPRWGLDPYRVRRESVGFIFNRIWAAIKRESLAVVAEGVATPEEVDAIYAKMLGAPTGPFRLMDMVGLDVVLDIEDFYAQEREGVPEGPRALLREKIAAGRLGRKTGRGFYEYES